MKKEELIKFFQNQFELQKRIILEYINSPKILREPVMAELFKRTNMQMSLLIQIVKRLETESRLEIGGYRDCYERQQEICKEIHSALWLKLLPLSNDCLPDIGVLPALPDVETLKLDSSRKRKADSPPPSYEMALRSMLQLPQNAQQAAVALNGPPSKRQKIKLPRMATNLAGGQTSHLLFPPPSRSNSGGDLTVLDPEVLTQQVSGLIGRRGNIL